MKSSVKSSAKLDRSWDIALLPGLSEADQAKLRQCGIQTTQDLLKHGRSIDRRQALATRLQIHVQHVNKWVALADLARVPAVGCQHCGLLLHAGIGSPHQLAQTPLPRLHQQILKLQIATLQRRDLCPSLGEVNRWIEQAKRIATVPLCASRSH
ncbi:MAG: DUF4332 domain-containing protein [Leptolyngbyaceae cyanobacterium SM1_3_5]|nr:DUF4332 domain-containing protein [Leptolyngbyaceae cyanobacterium SM1_3_5]